jgi:hypothetical protein
MTKGQFALLTGALALATMGGAGYIAYASTAPSPHDTGSSSGAATSGRGSSGASGGVVAVPSSGESAGSAQDSAGAAVQCVNGDIQVTDSEGQGAAGEVSLLLIFRNVSGHSCSLYGYPGASLVGPGGEDLLDAEREHPGLSKIPDIVLASGGQASAVVEWSDVQNSSVPGGCAVQNATSLMVTPPNFTQSSTLSIASGTDVCSGFEIHPVVNGVAGALTGE